MITVTWPAFRCARCNWKPPIGATSDDCEKHVIAHYVDDFAAALRESVGTNARVRLHTNAAGADVQSPQGEEPER